MASLDRDKLRQYLASLHGAEVFDLSVRRIGEPGAEDSAEKQYGYGHPLLLCYRAGEARRRAVLHTMAPGPFAHQDMADRAAVWLWSHRAFNRMPKHVASRDVGAFREDGSLMGLGDAAEFFLLTDYAEGTVYAQDLHRLRNQELTDRDRSRCDALCDHLLEIHDQPCGDPVLYVRRIRELVGHGECLMGIADGYPPGDPVAPPPRLEAIEQRAVRWRWKLKGWTDRCRRVHGDLHPWNILFDQHDRITLLDRSRGEFGEPADDVVSLTINYLFEALQSGGEANGSLRDLFDRFWRRYLEGSDDPAVLEAAPPFLAFRSLVLANPIWYPGLDPTVRDRFVTLAERVLDAERFEPARVDEYFDA